MAATCEYPGNDHWGPVGPVSSPRHPREPALLLCTMHANGLLDAAGRAEILRLVPVKPAPAPDWAGLVTKWLPIALAVALLVWAFMSGSGGGPIDAPDKPY